LAVDFAQRHGRTSSQKCRYGSRPGRADLSDVEAAPHPQL
jgi:hypothetical protein